VGELVRVRRAEEQAQAQAQAQAWAPVRAVRRMRAQVSGPEPVVSAQRQGAQPLAA
jgi:hypothetical protein